MTTFEGNPPKPYTVWLYYWFEGWSPHDFKTKEEALDFIRRNEVWSRGMRITKELSLSINDE